MVLRGLLVAASGFLFIFSPGLPIGLLARRTAGLNRDFIYWGIGLWAVAQFLSLLVQFLLRPLFQPDPALSAITTGPDDYALSFVGALITSFFVAGALFIKLYWSRRGVASERLYGDGMSLGFGVGLISQIFTGLSLVGAGFRLVFGDAATATLAAVAVSGYSNLLFNLLPLILFRPALLVISAATGVLVARSITERARFFWLAVLVQAVFVWALVAMQFALGGAAGGGQLGEAVNPFNALATIAYYLVAFVLGYRWVAAQFGKLPDSM